MSRRKLLAALVIIVALSVAISVAWRYASNAFREGIEEWAAVRQADGIQASYSSITMQGFPFRLQATIRSPVLAKPVPRPPWAGGPDLDWEWRGNEVVAGIKPWSPNRIDLHFPGTHQITVPFGPRGTTVFAAASKADGTFEFDSLGVPTAADLYLQDFDMLSEDGEESVSMSRMEIAGVTHAASTPAHQSATFELAVSGKGINLPLQLDVPLGRFINDIELQASLMGVFPPGDTTEAAIAWRDDGGTIEIHRLHLEWGPLVVEAGGTLALDAALQPIAGLSAIVRGYAETIDALVSNGVVQYNDGQTAKQVLGLLAKSPKAGGPPELTVPLTLQNGWIYVGPVALARVSQVYWN